VVIRDAQGNVVATLVKTFHCITDAEMAMAMGAWEAVSLCAGRGYSQVVF
jgi:hypothetical protein